MTSRWRTRSVFYASYLDLAQNADLKQAIEDDAVTEYSFSSDSDIVDEIDVSDHGEDVITISSDSERGDQFTPSGVTDRPWREEHFGQEARRQYELMFSNIQQNAFGRDTEKIEDYLAQQDGQMELYVNPHLVKCLTFADN